MVDEHGEILPIRYLVVENTPGYLPDDDEPPGFTTYAEAMTHLVAYNKELVDEIGESGVRYVTPIVNGAFSYGMAHMERHVEIIDMHEK
jgi:hypothetical protein